MKRMWIVQNKNLEAQTIIGMLKFKGEEVTITEQKGVATWEGLEEEIKDWIEANTEYLIYGVEIEGECPSCCVEISFREVKKPVKNEYQATLEVVAEEIGYELSLHEKFIAVNERYYIPGMQEYAKKLNFSDTQTKQIIDEIRAADRRAQGISLEHELETIKCLENKEEHEELIVVRLPHNYFATATDRLYGQYKNLLVVSPDKIGFFGDGYLCSTLYEMFGGKQGGNLPQEGFYLNTESIDKIEAYVNKRLVK